MADVKQPKKGVDPGINIQVNKKQVHDTEKVRKEERKQLEEKE